MNKMIYTLLTRSILLNQKVSISEDGEKWSDSKRAGELTRTEIESLSEWDNVYMYTAADKPDTINLLFSNS